MFFRIKIILIMSLMVYLISGFRGFPVEAKPLKADDIIYKAEEQYEGQTAISDRIMVLINSSGSKRVRTMKIYRKNFGDDDKDEKSVIFFLAPPDIKNTAYLSFDWGERNKEDDSWLYLPALKKVKRIAPGDKSNAFMGSDFTFTDMKSSTREYWDYKIIKDSDMVNGKDCWVLEGIPKKNMTKKTLKETGYLKIHIWVQKDIFMKVKGKFWVKKGRRIKFFKVSEIEKINNIWTAKKQQMVTTKKGKVEHSTILRTQSITYDAKLEDSFFASKSLERGYK